jgi:putative ABC transport system permease protein
VDPDLPVTLKTMAQLIAADTASPRFVLALLGVFAIIAVALATCGIYGVVSHAVGRRSGELAVRLALGATPSGILALVVREHLAWVVGGIAAGVFVAHFSMRLLASQLYGLTPTDIPTYTAAALVLVAVGVLSDVVPAWRTTRIMPADVLRSE